MSKVKWRNSSKNSERFAVNRVHRVDSRGSAELAQWQFKGIHPIFFFRIQFSGSGHIWQMIYHLEFHKVNNFCDFLFTLLHTQHRLKTDLQEWIAPKKCKLFPFKVDTIQKGTKPNWYSSPLKVQTFPLIIRYDVFESGTHRCFTAETALHLVNQC